MTSIITEQVHILVKGPAETRVQDVLAVLKTHWWPSSVFCSFVWLLSLCGYILHFHSQFYLICILTVCNYGLFLCLFISFTLYRHQKINSLLILDL